LVKNNKKVILKKKNFLVKNENFWPIVGDVICPQLSFGQFTMKVIKKSPLWAISRKAPYRIFSNMPFWKALRVLKNTLLLVFL
jgi:hypothetical protein